MAFVLPAIADQLVIVLLGILVIVLAPLEAAVAVLTFGVAAFGYRRFVYGRTGQASGPSMWTTEWRTPLRTSRSELARIALLQAQGHFVGPLRRIAPPSRRRPAHHLAQRTTPPFFPGALPAPLHRLGGRGRLHPSLDRVGTRPRGHVRRRRLPRASEFKPRAPGLHPEPGCDPEP